MAILNNGPFGNLRGKLGNVVIYTLNGQVVMRSLPSKKRAKSKGRQKASQELFTQVMKPMQFARDFLRISFAGNEGRSPYHSALSLNARRMAENGIFCYSELRFSQGKLAGATELGLRLNDVQLIEVTWTGAEAGKPAAETDGAVVLVLNPVRKGVEFGLSAGKRADKHAVFKLTAAQPGDKLEVYLLFMEVDKSLAGLKYMMSESQWLGSVVVPSPKP